MKYLIATILVLVVLAVIIPMLMKTYTGTTRKVEQCPADCAPSKECFKRISGTCAEKGEVCCIETI